jgi:uncharacterized protein
MDEPMTEDVSGARRGAGGTEGGVGAFLLGVAMASAGGYLLASRVVVHSGVWRLFGYDSFGLALIPLMAGIAMLFFNGRNFFGWLLTVAGLAIILAGVLMSMDIYFMPTNLFNTIMMLVLLMGGIGLIARAVRPWGR